MLNASPANLREMNRSLYADDYPSRNNDRANAISAVDRRARELTQMAISSGTTRDIVRVTRARARMLGALSRRDAQVIETANTASKGNTNG